MAHTKSGGTTKNSRDSQPKYLGVKLSAGETAQPGSIIVRQKGNKFHAGKNVGQGKDYTLFSLISGKVKFLKKGKTKFNGKKEKISLVTVEA